MQQRQSKKIGRSSSTSTKHVCCLRLPCVCNMLARNTNKRIKNRSGQIQIHVKGKFGENFSVCKCQEGFHQTKSFPISTCQGASKLVVFYFLRGQILSSCQTLSTMGLPIVWSMSLTISHGVNSTYHKIISVMLANLPPALTSRA